MFFRISSYLLSSSLTAYPSPLLTLPPEVSGLMVYELLEKELIRRSESESLVSVTVGRFRVHFSPLALKSYGTLFLVSLQILKRVPQAPSMRHSGFCTSALETLLRETKPWMKF